MAQWQCPLKIMVATKSPFAHTGSFLTADEITTLEKSHRTVGEKNDFSNSFREKNHIRTKFSI